MTGKDILATAAREIGYHEGEGKKNKFGEWFGMNGVAWCMEFVQWVYHQCGADLPLKTASCGGLLRWYRRNQPECVAQEPVPGCIVIFDFPGTSYDTDHTGIFVSKSGTHITTIDGNTSGGSDANGGWVQERTRKLSYANPIYIIPKGLTKEDEIDMTKQEFLDSLTEDDAIKIVELAQKGLGKRKPSKWAADVCKEAVKSGVFTDGDKDGSLDAPQALVTREQLAQTFKNAGALE